MFKEVHFLFDRKDNREHSIPSQEVYYDYGDVTVLDGIPTRHLKREREYVTISSDTEEEEEVPHRTYIPGQGYVYAHYDDDGELDFCCSSKRKFRKILRRKSYH